MIWVQGGLGKRFSEGKDKNKEQRTENRHAKMSVAHRPADTEYRPAAPIICNAVIGARNNRPFLRGLTILNTFFIGTNCQSCSDSARYAYPAS